MNSIGFRVAPNCVYYSIVKKSNDNIEIIDVNKIKVPQNTEITFQLKFIRNHILSLIKEYDIKKAGIRATENNARSISIPRLYIEGVIIELFSESEVENYYVGTISKIASLLKVQGKMIKKYIDNLEVFMNIDIWSTYCKESRESIITSVAACNL